MVVTRLFVITGLFVALAPALASAERGERHQPRVPSVPVDIVAPAGHSVYLKGYAVGTQNYLCAVTKTGTLDWTFLGPQATLFLTSHGRPVRQSMTHFLSENPDEVEKLRPTWQDSDDSSAVWGLSIRSSQDSAYVDADAIPWLLLEVVGDRRGPNGGRALVRTTFIQRLNTSGGRKPAAGCTVTDDIGAAKFVPYTAEYISTAKTECEFSLARPGLVVTAVDLDCAGCVRPDSRTPPFTLPTRSLPSPAPTASASRLP